MHSEGSCKLAGVEESRSILREILIKAQPITIPLQKENERTKKHLLWIHEGLLKDAECEKKKFSTALKRHRACLFVLRQAELVGDGAQQCKGLGLFSPMGQRKREREQGFRCSLEWLNNLSSSLHLAWQPVSRVLALPSSGRGVLTPPLKLSFP